MSYRQLFIFVEGGDDERFFKRVIEPTFKKRYDSIKIIKYAQMTHEKIKQYIKSITRMDAEYIFVTDLNSATCVTAKKEVVKQKINNIDTNNIIVVNSEIESWYVSGFNRDFINKYKIRRILRTEDVTKEVFDDIFSTLKLREFSSKIDFMIEITNYFSMDIAISRNKSFNYFYYKYLQPV